MRIGSWTTSTRWITASLPDLPRLRFRGLVYRALNPVWHRQPLSGEGARLSGGRFNRRGRPALYTACDVQTALAEVSRVGRPLQPTTLVSYAADVDGVFDATDSQALAAAGVEAGMLADPDWRGRMLAGTAVPTQDLAERLMGSGFRGMMVPSYAASAQPGARNLVLWDWAEGLAVHDDEGRLNP